MTVWQILTQRHDMEILDGVRTQFDVKGTSVQFVHHDLGYRSKGEIVEVTLSGNAANVRLLDSANFSNYRNGRRHRAYGGHVRRSPVRIPVPHSAHWHVAVDLGGRGGSVRSSVRVLSGALPPYHESSLSTVPSLVHRADEGEEKDYDVFISHASEDQDSIVRPLAHALRDEGLEVWYSEFQLKLGDSLRRKIDDGIAKSRFGIVVLSESFLRKGWPNYELDGLVTRGIDGEQTILPIWHGLTKQQVMNYSPSLGDKLARSTATHTVEEIATEIASLIRGE